MQKPLVSILTPFKNTAQFLPECIISIREQTYSNWELLIVNDGSADDSYEIVRSYADQDSRIKLFNNDGEGIIEALRLAYRHSSGDLITRMDSDDIMTPDKLEVLAGNLKTYGKRHVAIGLVKYFSGRGISDGYNKYERWLNALTKEGQNYSEIYKECVIPSPCWMIHREDLERCDAFKPDRYPEDYDLTFRFYEQGYQCIPCGKLLHYWRDYDTRTSRTHEHYAQNYFLNIKLHYFLKLDFDASRPLSVWGAGFKGKAIAKNLVELGIPFYWICDNPKKIGKQVYGQKMLPFEYLPTLKNPQSVITVANAEAQCEIRKYLKQHGMQSMADYFFFC